MFRKLCPLYLDCSRVGSKSFVSRKWPRWLAWNIISRPSLESCRLLFIKPALLTSPCSGSCKAKNSCLTQGHPSIRGMLVNDSKRRGRGCSGSVRLTFTKLRTLSRLPKSSGMKMIYSSRTVIVTEDTITNSGRPHLGRGCMHFVQDGLLGLFGALRGSAGHDDSAAHANQLLASFKSDACISSCDDIDLPSKVYFLKAPPCDVLATNISCQSEVSSCAQQRWDLSTKTERTSLCERGRSAEGSAYQGESGGLLREEMRQPCEGHGERSLQDGDPIVFNLHSGDAKSIQAEMIEETQPRPYETHFLFTATKMIDRIAINQMATFPDTNSSF